MSLKTSLLLSLLGSFTSAPIGIVSSQVEFHSNENDEILLNKLISDIDRGKTTDNTKISYSYNGEIYDSYQAIVDHLIEGQPIEAVQTTSNPNKIITNYEYEELDPNRIYSTDIDEYVKVYKNALGRVVKPNCPDASAAAWCVIPKDETDTAERRALNSFVNPGLTKTLYTYFANPDANQWFEQPEIARQNYEDRSYEIGSSLFYKIDGLYYNAFNQADMDKLKKNPNFMTPIYRYNGAGLTASDDDLASFWAPEDDFKKEYNERLYNWLIENDKFDDAFVSPGDYSLALTLDPFDSIEISTYGTNASDYIEVNGKTITIKNKTRWEYGYGPNELKQSIANKANWAWYNGPTIGLFKCNDFHGFKLDLPIAGGNGNEDNEAVFAGLKFDLKTKGNSCAPGYNEAHVQSIQFELDTSQIKIKNKNFEENPGMQVGAIKNIFGNYKEEAIEFKTLLEAIGNVSPYTPEIIANELYKKAKVSVYDESYKKMIFDLYFDLAYSSVSSLDTTANWLAKEDYAYGGGDGLEFSFNLENEEEHQIIAKNPNHYQDNQKVKLEGMPDFETEYANWRDHFNYLEIDNTSARVSLVKMHYAKADAKTNVTEVSGLETFALAPTEQGARELQFQQDQLFYQTKHVVYSLDGTSVEFQTDLNSAYESLRNQIDLEYRLVSKAELSNYVDQDVFWSDLISDGEYTVYKTIDNDGDAIYFKSYDDAIKMFENATPELNAVETIRQTFYNYAILINGQVMQYSWSTDEELKDIAIKILKLQKGEQ